MAIRGFTLTSIASRHASTASSRRRIDSGDHGAAAVRESPDAVRVHQRGLGPGLDHQRVPVEPGQVDQGQCPGSRAGSGWPATSAASPGPSTHPWPPRVAAAVPLPVPPAPIAVSSASRSVSLRDSLAVVASSSAALISSSAQVKTSAGCRSANGIRSTASRRERDRSSAASRRARPRGRHTPRQPTAPSPVRPRPRSPAPTRWRRPRRSQRHQPAPGANGHRHVVRVIGRRAQQEHRPLRRLLDSLQQSVGRTLGEPVRVLDDHHLPAAGGRPAGGDLHQRRISATEIDRPSGATTRTSACVPCNVVRQPGHSPQPGRSSVTALQRRRRTRAPCDRSARSRAGR